MAKIAVLARQNLPAHIRLFDVRCDYGSPVAEQIKEEFEVVFEYQALDDSHSADTMEEIGAFQVWSEALVQAIRAKWPPSTIRIVFSEKGRPPE